MIEMSRTERIARAMFDKRWEDDTGKTIYDPVSFDLIDYGGKKQIMEAAKACEIAMQEFAMACEYNDLVYTVAGAMQEAYYMTDYGATLPWDTAPSDIKKQWTDMAKVAIDTYRNYIFAPTDNAVILDYVVQRQ